MAKLILKQLQGRLFIVNSFFFFKNFLKFFCCVIDWAINIIMYTWPTSINFFFTLSQAFKVTLKPTRGCPRVLLALVDVAVHGTRYTVMASLSTNVRISSMENNQKATSVCGDTRKGFVLGFFGLQALKKMRQRETKASPTEWSIPPLHTKIAFRENFALSTHCVKNFLKWRIGIER